MAELEDLEVRGIFDREEIRKIVRMRTAEYRLQARAPDKMDYLRYIKYEYNLGCLRRKRRRISAQEEREAQLKEAEAGEQAPWEKVRARANAGSAMSICG